MITRINNIPTDQYNNKWSSNVTDEEAQIYSDTLTNCSNCSCCADCSNCADCADFSKNPQRIISDFIGSRCAQTVVYWNEEKIHVVCGCFKGTLTEFESRVNIIYPIGSKHFVEYTNFINRVKTYMLP